MPPDMSDLRHRNMDDVIVILKDLEPAAYIVLGVAVAAVISSRVAPRVGPWVSLLALMGATVYVLRQVIAENPRPSWAIPLALAGVMAAAGAAYRVWNAARARSMNDKTVAYVFPTALAIFALWLSIALLELDSAPVTSALTG